MYTGVCGVRVSEAPSMPKPKRKRDDALFVAYAIKNCMRENENILSVGWCLNGFPATREVAGDKSSAARGPRSK